ncbi:hypothetical protein Lser_V15G23478 [Lactuca serriola]
MRNQELLDNFKDYEKDVKARHSYGPKGHRGMSVLIFESSVVGYMEAERLNKHFENEGTDRDAWDQSHRRILFYPGGQRQLYGYMATKRDLDFFNQHCQGKSKLKFELVSYHERVVNELKQMNENNQQLIWYKNRIAKEQMHSKALEESFTLMDSQEQFFKNQVKIIEDARNEKEGNFDKLQREERMRVEQSYSVADPQKRDEKLEEMKKLEEEREKLMRRLEENRTEMKRRYWKEEIELEEGFNAELTRLMEKYIPKDKMEGPKGKRLRLLQ